MAASPINHHTPGILQIVAVSDYKKQQPVGYFSLPPEIRNMIMELVLVPGQVALVAPKSFKRHRSSLLQRTFQRVMKTGSQRREKDLKPTCISWPPGFQLLATCKQACAEGQAVFYTSNVFVLPPGPVVIENLILKNLHPQQRAMIKRIGIRISLRDLTPEVFDEVQLAMQASYGTPVPRTPSAAQGVRWSGLVDKELRRIWEAKLKFIVKHFESVNRISFGLSPDAWGAGDEWTAKDLEFFKGLFEGDDQIYVSPWMLGALVCAAKLASKHIEDIVTRNGWEAVKAKVKNDDFEGSIREN